MLLILCNENCRPTIFLFFFFNDTATTEIYTLSLHDALPISMKCKTKHRQTRLKTKLGLPDLEHAKVAVIVSLRSLDRKSTRLNSSHANISYAVFCLKKKKKLVYTTDEENKEKKDYHSTTSKV